MGADVAATRARRRARENDARDARARDYTRERSIRDFCESTDRASSSHRPETRNDRD